MKTKKAMMTLPNAVGEGKKSRKDEWVFYKVGGSHAMSLMGSHGLSLIGSHALSLVGSCHTRSS